ncbi:MAG: hypothetical protein LBE35_07445 [Clostridiales bacterium]|jgi:hypothetical protein|nr:hypothetical protein [Clostridiales bacterium]
MTKKKGKLLKIILLSLGGLVATILVTFIPTLNLETRGMSRLEGEYVTVFFEAEETAARAVFELAEAESRRITEALGLSAVPNINIYVYDNQSTMQARRFGWLVLLLNLDWFVGTNRGTDVLLVSPANPGAVHDWDVIMSVAIHEMVHAYNYLLNRNMRLWIDEGLATYLSGQSPRGWLRVPGWPIPTVEEMRTSNPLRFNNINGYPFSYTFIEFLHERFGWDSVLTLARTNDFYGAFGLGERAVYGYWVEFLKTYYGY